MGNVLDTLRPRLSEPVAYTSREEGGMRPYNRFMTTVTGSLPVAQMDNDTEMTFCMYAACVLEEAWKKHVVINEGETDQMRFLEILVRYLLNVVKVQEECVVAFLEEGHELMSSEFGSNVAKLAARTFEEFTDGDPQSAAGFKFFVEQRNFERK